MRKAIHKEILMENILNDKHGELNVIGEVASEDMPGMEAFIKAITVPQFSHAAHCPTDLIEKMREEYAHAPAYVNNNKDQAR